MTTVPPGLARVRSAPPVVAVLVAAGVLGYVAVEQTLLAVAVACLPLMVGLLGRPSLVVVLALATVPFTRDISGGALPVVLGTSDLLLGVALVSVTVGLVMRPDVRQACGVLQPLAMPFVVYTSGMLVVIAAHPEANTLLNSFQRLQLSLLPAVLAATVCSEASVRRGLRAFVLSAALLGMAFALNGFGGTESEVLGVQKNPAGQFMASAVLLLIAAPHFQGRWRLLLLPLSVGLVATQSRGALLALAVSLLLLLTLKGQVPRGRLLVGAVALAGLAALAFRFLPASAQDRLTNFDARTDNAVAARDDYREDALAVIRQAPWLGVGVGNYLAGERDDLTLTSDPHNVLLLEFAEGGIVLGAGFLVLVLAPVVVLVRIRQSSPYAAVAVAVHVGVVVHGLVDTYWVRSTPVLGWFLVGLALATVQMPPRALGGRSPAAVRR